MDVVGVRHVRLVHLHEVDAHEDRLGRIRIAVEVVDRRLFDITVEERNADHALRGRIDILPVDLEVLASQLPGIARHRALGHPCEHRTQLRRHIREPTFVSISVSVEMIEPAIPHLVIALRIGQRVVGLAEMPLAGEEGLVAAGLEHGGQRPFLLRQAAALALEGHGGHAAAVRDTSGLHCGAAGRAARLRIERKERHSFRRHAVNVGSRHAAADTATVGPEIAIAGVVRHDHDDVGLLLRGRLRLRTGFTGQRERRERRRADQRRRGSRVQIAQRFAYSVSNVWRSVDKNAVRHGVILPYVMHQRLLA